MSHIEITTGDKDNHSGFFYIAEGKTVLIKEYRQMFVNETLDIDGILNVEGKLIIEE